MGFAAAVLLVVPVTAGATLQASSPDLAQVQKLVERIRDAPAMLVDDLLFQNQPKCGTEQLALTGLDLVWRDTASRLRPPASKETVTELIVAKRKAMASCHSVAIIDWYDFLSPENVCPEGGVLQQFWWARDSQLMVLQFRDDKSGDPVRIDMISDGKEVTTTSRVRVGAVPVVSASRGSVQSLYAPSAPLIQSGVLPAAWFGMEPQGPYDLENMLSEPDVCVLEELPCVCGKQCVVMAIGSPPIARVYLSVSDEFLPVRYESYSVEFDSSSGRVNRKLTSVCMVLSTLAPPEGWSLPEETVSASFDAHAGSATWMQHIRVQSAGFDQPLPPLSNVLAIEAGSLMIAPDRGLAVRRLGGRSSIDGALRTVTGEYLSQTNWLGCISIADRAIALVIGTGVVVFAVRRLAKRHLG